MSKNDQILRKLMLAQENPDLNIGFDTKDLAALVITVMKAVKTIEESMNNGQLDIGAKLKKDIEKAIADGSTMQKQIAARMSDVVSDLESQANSTKTELTAEVKNALATLQAKVDSLTNGDDGVVTDAEIQRAAEIATALIELPDFDEMVDTAIKSGGESIVDAINLLPDGDGVEISKVKGLLSLIDQVKTQIARIPTGQGGTIGKGQVYNFIRQAVADGTISTGSSLPDQSGNNGKFLSTDGTDASWATLAGGGDMAAAVYDPAGGAEQVAFASDLGTAAAANTGDFATAAQGALADSATQPGDNISDLVNDAGYITAETDDQTAAEVPFTPAGDIVATDVQAAIEELDGEKLGVDALSANLILYPTTTASDIGGYAKLASNIADPDYDATAANVSTGAITTTSQLISSLASEAGIIEGELGVLNNTVIGNIRRTAGSGTATFYFEVYKRSSGGTETLLETSANTLPVSAGTYVQFSAAGLINNGPFLLTDRIVLKFYGNRIAGGSDPTYDFQFGGSIPTRALFPLPLTAVPTDAHNELSGLQGGTTDEYYHLTAAEDTFLNDITATAAEVNLLDGVTATTAELNFVDGVTSNVQAQLDSKPGSTIVALGNLGATEAIDLSAGDYFHGTLDANVTITFTNETEGLPKTIILGYDGTAQRTITMSDVDEWANGASPLGPTSTAKETIVTAVKVNGTVYGFHNTVTASGGSGVTITNGTGAPSSTPAAIGDMYLDTDNNRVYHAFGSASSADWRYVSTVANPV